MVAFGDGDNDVEFLEYAGLGVAMKNAGRRAQEAADDVTELTNDQDGVAFYIEKLESSGFAANITPAMKMIKEVN